MKVNGLDVVHPKNVYQLNSCILFVFLESFRQSTCHMIFFLSACQLTAILIFCFWSNNNSVFVEPCEAISLFLVVSLSLSLFPNQDERYEHAVAMVTISTEP